MGTVSRHAARKGRYSGTHEPKPARIAREPGGRIRNSRPSRWIYALLGGAGAVGVGQIARTSADTDAQPAPTVHLVATMPSSTMQSPTRPGEMTPAELKRDMAEAMAAIDQSPIYQSHLKRYMAATGGGQNLLSAATTEVLQSLSATKDAAAIDSARANITKEVQALPALADLSVQTVGAFAASLLIDILKGVRRRLIDKAVDVVLPEPDRDDPRLETGEASLETGQMHPPPSNAEIQELVDKVIEDSFRRAFEQQALSSALDKAERAVAAELQRRPQVLINALTMTPDDAVRIAATARHEAALLITPIQLG
jgi:hypothetical protein